MKDILSPIESIDIKKKEKIKFDDKDLSQMTLPERAAVLSELMRHVEENPDLTDEEKEVVNKIKLSVEEKCLAWGYVIKKIQEAREIVDYEIQYHKDKITELNTRKGLLQNRINSRSVYLDRLMNQLGKKKLEAATYSVILKKQRDELAFTNPDDFDKIDWSKYPDNLYEKIPASVKVKKKDLKEYLKTNKSDDFSMVSRPLKIEVK